jgi:small subunit ribosomal protein S15
MAISSSTRQQLVRDNRTHEKDTGSPEVQVALLTEQIKMLTEHLRTHPKDYSSRRGLLFKVNRRNKLLKYLQRNDTKRYAAVVGKFELRR